MRRERRVQVLVVAKERGERERDGGRDRREGREREERGGPPVSLKCNSTLWSEPNSTHCII